MESRIAIVTMRVTDRQIFRMDFVLQTEVCPTSKKSRITKKSVYDDMNKLRESKFGDLAVPYARWSEIEVEKISKDKWLIYFQFDNEDTSTERVQKLSSAYFFVITQGVNMLNDTGFFKNKYLFSVEDFELITIDIGYLQSDGKTVQFENHE